MKSVTPFASTYTLRFAGPQLTLVSEQNVGAADTRTLRVVGRLENAGSAPQE